jgi:hypothetical protein
MQSSNQWLTRIFLELNMILKAPQIYRPHGLEAKLIVTRVLELL